MSEEQVHMRVWRGDAAGGEFKDYRIAAGEGMVVLDVIHAIQAQQANDLAVRWNCKAGKCGSCSAEVNGKPRLMCMTRMNTFQPGETITVSPVKTFPIIRDLVTDVSYNYEKAREVLPGFDLSAFRRCFSGRHPSWTASAGTLEVLIQQQAHGQQVRENTMPGLYPKTV